jgi:phosphonate transport system substrate-binding protein
MKKILFSLLAFFLIPAAAPAVDRPLVFGAIAVKKASQVRESLDPLIRYLADEMGREIVFETGKDYPDTIAKFRSGRFDLGYIGPSPYVLATAGAEPSEVFRLVGGLETDGEPYYYTVIIAAAGNGAIKNLDDVNGKVFGFGSRQSTLSCYVPCKMLMDQGVFDTLNDYRFLGRHDKVVQYVAGGMVDAGGIKEAVALRYPDKIKIVGKSEPIYDFLLVAHHSMEEEPFQRLRRAALSLKDPGVLGAIKPGVTGFIETRDENYQNLRTIMHAVDEKLGTNE